VAQFSALVVRYGGCVVHGSQPTFTPVVAEQARCQAREGTIALRLFASQLFGQIPETTLNAARIAKADVVLTAPIGNGGATDPETRNHSLTAMRMAMMQEADVVVAVGGKLHAGTGFNPGVLEELAQARWHDQPCFVIGAFGGSVAQLELPVLEELSVGNRFENTSHLAEFATWTDRMDEYAGKLLAHLTKYAGTWTSRHSRDKRPLYVKQPSELVNEHVRIIEIDPDTAGKWQKRFVELRNCIEKKDTARACKLLAEK
jgi:hypothetical protein